MADVLNWWASMGDVLPDDETLATAVADELEEPLDDVRPSVMTATLVRRVDASLDDLRRVVEGERERARVRDVLPRRRPERAIRAETLDGLFAEARRLADTGALDLAAAIAVQRAAGGIAARAGLRLVLFLARLAVIRRMVWERCVEEQRAGRLDGEALGEMGRWIFLWTEVTSLVVTDGYRATEREILARDAQRAAAPWRYPRGGLLRRVNGGSRSAAWRPGSASLPTTTSGSWPSRHARRPTRRPTGPASTMN